MDLVFNCDDNHNKKKIITICTAGQLNIMNGTVLGRDENPELPPKSIKRPMNMIMKLL